MKSENDIRKGLEVLWKELDERKATLNPENQQEKVLIAKMEGYIQALEWVLQN